MKKNKKALLYHPTTLNCNYRFSELVSELSLLPSSSLMTMDRESNRYVISFNVDSGIYTILLKKLKNDELPKVADFNTGSNEMDLEMPEGMSLSYKNVFVYDSRKNVLAAIRLSSCPQIGALRECLEKLAHENLPDYPHPKIQFNLIFKRGLADVLRKADSITMAKIKVEDYYGDNIDESRLGAYKRYVVGENCTSTVEIKRKRRADIRDIVSELIADEITYGAPPEGISVQMCIDGEVIDFSKYYKQYPVQIQTDSSNAKYLDYKDLETQLLQVILEFGAENEDA